MKGWLGVAAVVMAYDAWAAATGSPTLSAQFERATVQHPTMMGVVTAYLVVHLWGQWPRRADPFCGFSTAIVLFVKR